ncbi:MAG TPA: hypothetical protein VGL56_01795 [Fimbriimonadaceae bacterium]|jgi:hypothetical protein
MKLFALLVGLSLAALSSAQVRMEVTIDGHKAGTATLSQRRNPQGEKVVEFNAVLDIGENSVTIRSESIFNPGGAPTRMFQNRTTSGKDHSTREIIVSFDADGANVVLLENGDRSTKHVTAPATPSRDDASEFWFLRDSPDVGTTSTAARFNLDTLAWDTVNTSFKGTARMTIGKHRVNANITESEEGKAFVDAEGLPLRLELTNTVMERIWEKS